MASLKRRAVTAIMPADQVKIMLLTYKATVSDIDAEVVRMLRQRVDGDIEDYVIDYLPVRNNSADEEHMILASVARRDHVDRLLALFTAAGLQVHCQPAAVDEEGLKSSLKGEGATPAQVAESLRVVLLEQLDLTGPLD